jgi:hypothetical protein
MEDEYDIILKNKYCFAENNIFYYKRFFLPTVIILPCFFSIEVFRNNLYIFFSTFISLLILTWNFPIISKIFYSRPIYFEDLDDKEEEYKKSKRKIMYKIERSSKFKTRFLVSQQFFFSIGIAVVADYINTRISQSRYGILEMLGLIGGILSLMVKLLRFCGRIILYFIYKQKKKETNQIEVIETEHELEHV